MYAANPLRRWFQFSLRTLLVVVTLAAFALGWWNHRRYCLERAEAHRYEEVMLGWNSLLRDQWISEQTKPQHENTTANRARAESMTEYHGQLEAAYRRAVWKPWERLWIVETSEVTP